MGGKGGLGVTGWSEWEGKGGLGVTGWSEWEGTLTEQCSRGIHMYAEVSRVEKWHSSDHVDSVDPRISRNTDEASQSNPV